MVKADPICALLRRASAHLADKQADALGTLTEPQFLVLNFVSGSNNGAARQHDIVESIAMDRSTTSELVARMAREGLLTLQRGEEDRRTVLVRLTPRGRYTLQTAREKVARIEARLLKATPDIRAVLRLAAGF